MRQKHSNFNTDWNGPKYASKGPKKHTKKGLIKKLFKKFDLFGYPIQLNFDEKGSTYQTLTGGLLSISLLFLLFLLVIYKLVLMTRGESSSI